MADANTTPADDFLAQFITVSHGGLLPDDAPAAVVETPAAPKTPAFDSEGARAAELKAHFEAAGYAFAPGSSRGYRR